MRDLDLDAGQPQSLRDERGRHHSPVGADREDTLDALSPADGGHTVDIAEADRLADVAEWERHRMRIAVAGHDLVTDGLRVSDRGELRDTRTEKKQSGHRQIP